MDFRKIIPNLHSDESIYVFVRSYYVAFLPWIGLGIGMFVIGIVIIIIALTTFPEVQTNPIAYNILVIMGSAYFLLIIPFITVAFIDYYYDLHIVTDRRLIDVDQHSLFVREINELALEEVQDVTSRMVGVLGSIFDFGFVTIETSSATQKFEFDNVRHPREIAGIILDLADQAKQRIESGKSIPIVPSGKTKGNIDDVLYDLIEPLVELGAVTPEDHREISSAQSNSPVPRSEHTLVLGPLPIEYKEEFRPSNAPHPKQTASDEESGDDLDIIIDDPSQSKKTR
jgi:hypothetical protein